MAFCTTCGADVTSKSFCVQCGTAVASAQPAAVQAAQSPLPKKKVSPILWILLGIFGLFVLAGIAVTSAGLFLAHKVVQNPAMTMAKVLTAANPDVEVLSADEGRNTITFRDKKTRETVTMNFEDVKKGKIVFKGNNGQEATVRARADGDGGTLDITTPEGKLKIGAGNGASAKWPDWVPSYPGAKPEANFSVNSNEGEGGNFHFKTNDPAKNVLSFYEENLKRAGFTISGNIKGDLGAASGGMLAAEDLAKHTVMVTAGAESGATNVSVIFGTKKN